MKRAALLLCLAGLLAGCGSDDSSGPATLPPVSPSIAAVPTPSSTASAAVPKPPEADAFTSEGAAAFVRYYVDVINAAIGSNDASLLVALSAPECQGCQNYIASVEETARKGARADPGSLHVLNAVAPAIQDDETTVLLDFSADEYVSRDSAGREVSRFPAQTGLTAELRCVRKGSGWIVMGFRLAPLGTGK